MSPAVGGRRLSISQPLSPAPEPCVPLLQRAVGPPASPARPRERDDHLTRRPIASAVRRPIASAVHRPIASAVPSVGEMSRRPTGRGAPGPERSPVNLFLQLVLQLISCGQLNKAHARILSQHPAHIPPANIRQGPCRQNAFNRRLSLECVEAASKAIDSAVG
jgi:hypothetical protein